MQREIERGTLRQCENRFLRQLVLYRSRTWGSQVASLRGIDYRAVCELVMRVKRGTRGVPSETSVEKMRCRVESA